MAAEWRETTLGQLADFLSGGTPSTDCPEYWGGSIPWVSAKDMKKFRLDDTEDHVTELGSANGTRTIPAGTVLLLTRGMTLLNDLPICVADRSMAFNQDLKALRSKADMCNDFLPYLLLGNKSRLLRLVDLAGHGTGRLNTDELKALDVLLPPESEQRAIARILGALDDKIELNRQMNETLEAIARAIFEDWFARHDLPTVRASQLEESGVLEIGDGYRAKNSELADDGLPFIRAANLRDGFDIHGAEMLGADSVAKAGNKISRPGDVAFTSKGTVGRFARVGANIPSFVYSPQVCFWRSLDHDRLHPAVLYCWMTSDDLRRQIDAVAGQTDMALYVSLQDQRRMLVPVFPRSHLLLGSALASLLNRQSHNALENHTLAALRGLLLPKLISGEIRVRDAEKMVEAVA